MLDPETSHRAVTKSALGFVLGVAVCLVPPVAGIRAAVPGPPSSNAAGSTVGPVSVGLPVSTEAGPRATVAALVVEAEGLPAPVPIQEDPSASIAGVVLELTGARVPGAGILLEGGAAPILGISDSAGEYRIPDVPPGEYVLVARLPGFADHRQEVVIEEGQELLRDVLLSIGAVTTAMEVVSDRFPPEGPVETSEPERLRVTAGVTSGRIIDVVQPEYPPRLRADGVEGTVVLEGMIGADGAIAGLKVVSTDHAGLAIAALDAVRQWRYEPSRLNNVPVAVATTVSFTFRLD